MCHSSGTHQAAFMSGFHTAALVAAVLLTLVAGVAYVMFCKLPVLGGEAPVEAPAEIEGAGDIFPVPAE
jgi:hypothetical protein